MVDDNKRYITVGTRLIEVNEFEWNAAIAIKGQTVWFRHRIRRHIFDVSGELSAWKRGTFRGSHFYDGVIANVSEDDPDDLIQHSLFLDYGEQILLENPSQKVYND